MPLPSIMGNAITRNVLSEINNSIYPKKKKEKEKQTKRFTLWLLRISQGMNMIWHSVKFAEKCMWMCLVRRKRHTWDMHYLYNTHIYTYIQSVHWFWSPSWPFTCEGQAVSQSNNNHNIYWIGALNSSPNIIFYSSNSSYFYYKIYAMQVYYQWQSSLVKKCLFLS